MTDDDLLLSGRLPSRAQVRAISAAAALLFVAFLGALPFRHAPWAQIHAFIPIVDTVLLIADTLTAILLFTQAALVKSRALTALGTGYLFTGLLMIPHALAFPGAFAPAGVLGAGPNTANWLYFFWHAGLPLAVIAYVLWGRQNETGTARAGTTSPMVRIGIGVAVALAVAITLLTTVGERLLPQVMLNATAWDTTQVTYLAALIIGLNVAAMIAVMLGRRSLLDLWLLLALWAWLLDIVLVMTTTARFTGGWYIGRTAGLIAGVAVLLMLLAETNKLYTRLAIAVSAQRRERQNRLFSMDAVAAAIAHEVKQPLAAIVANAGAGLTEIAKDSPDHSELRAIFQAIEHDGLDAAQVANSIRAMFAHRLSARSSLNVNALIRDAAKLISGELAHSRISLQLALHDDLPHVSADRLQLQQVFLNLFANAIDAMNGVSDRQRNLVVRSAPASEREALVTVEDSGIGIDAAHADKIFEAFFTTKHDGTGMGLPLCRAIIEAHGGRVWASNGAQVGTVFNVRLPFEGPVRAAHAQT